LFEISILVLEDDRELRETLEAVLSVEGYRVVTAATGEEAVKAAMESEFDLVVTDIRMPGIDGLQALEEMRKHCGDVESLVVTGYSTEEDSIRAIRLGAGDYLTKPFKLEDFLASVETILARRREANRRKEEERNLRHSLLWAAQLLADRRLRAAQTVVRRLSGALQLSAVVSESIQLAVLLSGLPRETEGFGPTLPPQVEHILANLEERWDGSGVPQGLAGADIPLEARVAAVALGNEGLDPSLVALREAPEAAPAESLPGSQARGLISLGRALEEAGGGANAREAFEKVAADGGRSREKLDALHGLARLAVDPLEAREWLQKALELADSLGPLTSAASHLQAGLQVYRREPEGARALLRRALDLYRRLGHTLGEARAVLALAASGGSLEGTAEACTVLSEDVSDVADWLVPWLLTQEAEASVHLLRRVLRGAPRGVLRLLQKGHLDADLRLRLVARLQETGGTGSSALLRVLSKDDDPRVRSLAAGGLGEEEPAAQGPVLRIYGLGPLEAYWGEDRVAESDWKSRKTKQLFAMLASQRGRPVPEDRLVDVFWPDDERGKKNLNWTLSALRKALRQGEVVVRNVGGIALNPEIPRWHDLELVEDLIAAGTAELRGGGVARPERYHGLLELYRGPYLEECYLDWAVDIRHRLEAQLVPLLEGCVRQLQAAGQHHEGLEFLGCLSTVDPLHQEACLWTMQGYLALKRPELAIKQFKTFRDRLKRELQAEPSIELLEAHQRALLQT